MTLTQQRQNSGYLHRTWSNSCLQFFKLKDRTTPLTICRQIIPIECPQRSPWSWCWTKNSTKAWTRSIDNCQWQGYKTGICSIFQPKRLKEVRGSVSLMEDHTPTKLFYLKVADNSYNQMPQEVQTASHKYSGATTSFYSWYRTYFLYAFCVLDNGIEICMTEDTVRSHNYWVHAETVLLATDTCRNRKTSALKC